MTKEEIFNRLKEIFGFVVQKNNQISTINLETKIIDDLCLNSIAIVYMVFSIEKFFSISLSNITYSTFKTVGDIVDLIYSKVN